jgi:phosphoglycerol transferase
MHWAAHALLMGALLGAMTLIKVHALFLIPALGVYAFCLAWSTHKVGFWPRFWVAKGAAALSVLAAVGVKYALGYALADTNGLYLFGSFYGNQAVGTSHHGLLKLLAPGFINLRGHLMSIAVLFGLPLAVLAHALISRALRTEAGAGLSQLYWYTFLMLGAALGMTVLYTASIADFAPREGVRLHMRYYSFAFPLLLMIAAGAFKQVPRAGSRVGAVLIALALGSASLVALIKIPTYFLGSVDGPDIAMLDLTAWPERALVALNLLILGLWVARSRAAGALYLFVYVPALAVFAYLNTAAFQARLVHPSPFDKAGMHVHQTIPADQRDQITVAGTGLAELMRTKFHIDAAGVTLLEMAENAPYELSHLPARKKWLLVVGPHALPPELKPSVLNAQFALVPIAANHAPIGTALLNQAELPELLTRIDGLADVEPWGRWSLGSQVVLHFAQALPQRLTVILKAQAYGPNAGMDFVARVGQAEQRFRIPTTPTEVFLRFDTDGAQRTLTIDVPQPVSPQQLGHSIDVRQLGIGLIDVEIGQAAAPAVSDSTAPR